VLAARGVTALLIQSTLSPNCGNPLNSSFEYCPRNKPLALFTTRLALTHVVCDSRVFVVLKDVVYSGPTKHRTGPHRTAPDPKILGDGIDQTPQHTGGPDTLSQRGYGPTTLP